MVRSRPKLTSRTNQTSEKPYIPRYAADTIDTGLITQSILFSLFICALSPSMSIIWKSINTNTI